MAEKVETAEEKAEREAREKARADAVAAKQKIADAENAKRTGQGTRLLVGTTRGRSTVPFTYEAFDSSLPETMPKSVEDFMGLTTTDDGPLLNYLVEGYNSLSEKNAADPVNEFVDASWPEDVQKRFKIVIRNYSNDANVSIEDAVSLLKPGIQKGIDAIRLAEATPVTA
jgi:hypothetical protein